MIIELDLSDSDINIIKSAKAEGTKIENFALAAIGDIVLSSIKL